MRYILWIKGGKTYSEIKQEMGDELREISEIRVTEKVGVLS